MPFTSNIGGLPIIDRDDHPLTMLDPRGQITHGRGLIPRDFTKEPFGSNPYAAAFDIPVIPRDEWPERIEEIEKTKSSIPDRCDQVGLKVKNQRQTNYCWINAPVHALEIARVLQGQAYVELSPASVGAKIKNFRNVGGWGTEGLRYMAEHGVVPASFWPVNAIDRRYDTQEANAERADYQADEWWDLKPRNFDQLATCLLLRVPVPIGLNWWRHEVTAVQLVKLDGRDQYGSIIDNSWGIEWGDNGRGILTEAKATPDDAVALRLGTAS